jgi:hypothetical protein
MPPQGEFKPPKPTVKLLIVGVGAFLLGVLVGLSLKSLH